MFFQSLSWNNTSPIGWVPYKKKFWPCATTLICGSNLLWDWATKTSLWWIRRPSRYWRRGRACTARRSSSRLFLTSVPNSQPIWTSVMIRYRAKDVNSLRSIWCTSMLRNKLMSSSAKDWWWNVVFPSQELPFLMQLNSDRQTDRLTLAC